jgi:hypothetical protein
MTIWYILCSFGTFFSDFSIMYQEKSGNPFKYLVRSKSVGVRFVRRNLSDPFYVRTVTNESALKTVHRGAAQIG